MARVLYDNGKEIGEITEWTMRIDPPVERTFLGKTALIKPANDECTFVSPKPVSRRSKLTVVEDGKKRFVLEIIKVVGGTKIQAKIKS